MMCSRIYKKEEVREPRKDVAGSEIQTNLCQPPISVTERMNGWRAWSGRANEVEDLGTGEQQRPANKG